MANSRDDFRPSDADEVLAEHDLNTGSADADHAAGAGSLEQLQEELALLQDRLLRAQAETENVRRRAQREAQGERRFANQSLLVDLLPVLDNIERAVSAAEQNPDGSGLLEGFRMVHQQLLNTLEQHDCRRVPAEGVPFDPALHDAMLQAPSPDVPAGTVTQVHQQGYQLHDRVIRPAQVVVSSGPPQ